MKRFLFIALSCSVMLSGCAPLFITGAATGVGVLHDRRTVGTVIDDNTQEIKYERQISQNKLLADNSHVNITVYNGLALLTGEAFNNDIRQKIGQVIQENKEIKRVANYIIIGPRSSLSNRTYDVRQSAKVKSALFNVSIPGFDPTRVKVVTEQGKTFLMGLLTAKEASAVVEVARRVSGVRMIISLFEIVG